MDGCLITHPFKKLKRKIIFFHIKCCFYSLQRNMARHVEQVFCVCINADVAKCILPAPRGDWGV